MKVREVAIEMMNVRTEMFVGSAAALLSLATQEDFGSQLTVVARKDAQNNIFATTA